MTATGTAEFMMINFKAHLVADVFRQGTKMNFTIEGRTANERIRNSYDHPVTKHLNCCVFSLKSARGISLRKFLKK